MEPPFSVAVRACAPEHGEGRGLFAEAAAARGQVLVREAAVRAPDTGVVLNGTVMYNQGARLLVALLAEHRALIEDLPPPPRPDFGVTSAEVSGNLALKQDLTVLPPECVGLLSRLLACHHLLKVSGTGQIPITSTTRFGTEVANIDGTPTPVLFLLFPTIRFVNHDCAPNCVLTVLEDGLRAVGELLALRDIAAGEELTMAYDVPENLEANHGFRCRCHP
jgi:hypothetical protein